MSQRGRRGAKPVFCKGWGLFPYISTHGGGRMGVVAVCIAVCMAIWFNCFAVQYVTAETFTAKMQIYPNLSLYYINVLFYPFSFDIISTMKLDTGRAGVRRDTAPTPPNHRPNKANATPTGCKYPAPLWQGG